MRRARAPRGPTLLAAAALLALAGTPGAVALDLARCAAPLGMESGAIPDAAISASSAHDSSIVGPQHGRLCHDRHGGAWCPRNMVTLEAREYLQVDLGSMHAVSAVQTQGRFGNGMGQEYAEAYMLEYWRPGLDRWLRWRDRKGKELLQGNSNTYTVVEQRLEPPVLASRVRFVPYSEHLRTVCMRVELLGCQWTEGLLSYAMPQGAQRGPGLDLRDRIYDGRDEAGRLSGGLGQLTDGRRGSDLFRLDLQGHGKGYEWVGWRNDSAALHGRPVEITFEFDHVRNFSAMFLHTNNLYTKDVQVFSHAKVYFSVSGHQYSPEPVFFSYMADLALEHARNVTIKLHQRVGRFVKLQLHFAARWILLSEVAFDSVVVSGNFSDGDAGVSTGGGLGGAAGAASGAARGTAEGGRDDPLQRDEVQTPPPRDDTLWGAGGGGGVRGRGDHTVWVGANGGDNRGGVAAGGGGGGGGGAGAAGTGAGRAPAAGHPSAGPRRYIGLVIGVLTAVILLLAAAILFVAVRGRRAKAAGARSSLPPAPPPDKAGCKKVSLEEAGLEKGALYHEPFGPVLGGSLGGTLGGTLGGALGGPLARPLGGLGGPGPALLLRPAQSPDYTDVQVPDVVVGPRVYAEPNVQAFLPPSGPPPPVPPPPERYYAATSILKREPTPPPPPPPPPPVSPPPVGPAGLGRLCSLYGLAAAAAAAAAAGAPSDGEDGDADGDGASDEAVSEEDGDAGEAAPLLPALPRRQLRPVEHLGTGRFGDVHVCEVVDSPSAHGADGRDADGPPPLVVVKTLADAAPEELAAQFRQEVCHLARLRDPNIVAVVGANLQEEPLCVIQQYLPQDLNQLLQNHVAETACTRPHSARTLSYGCLIYMATQIASGMKYLESLRFVHRDLATRNCLVGDKYHVKISDDIGTCRNMYAADYYKGEGCAMLPVRWMAWESIILNQFSTKSDVWSFAVTLWEILTFAREQPFEDLTDDKVLDNATHYYHNNGQHVLLQLPINCPREIYDLMTECWQRNESERPNFREIHLFLQRKNLGYKPEQH